MPHGTPDRGHIGPNSTTSGLDDLGEAVVRLGSPHLWSRLGDVVNLTDFREGLGMWEPYLSGASCTLALSTGHTRQGAYSVKLMGDGLAICHGGLRGRFPFPVASGLGVEFSFSNADAGPIWELWSRLYDRADIWELAIRFNSTTGEVQYWDNTGAFVPLVAAIGMGWTNQPDNTMKLVWDMSTHQYVRFLLNDLAFPMPGIGFEDAGNTAVSRWEARLLVYRALGEVIDEWIDCVIVTQNEP